MKTVRNMKSGYKSFTHMIHCAFFIILCMLFVPSSAILAEEEVETDQETLDAIDEEIKWLQSETYVITASKVMEEIEKAPASITVINDRQIRQMGAKHLMDVIKREVPSYSAQRGGEVYLPYVRGYGFKILNMINSHSIYDVYSRGIYQWGYATLPMDNVKRIEFVRGPGSALYGSGAYDGMINVITKGAEDIDGLELTARGGSWDTQQYNLLFGKTMSGLEAVLNFNYFKTHGHRAFIKEDHWTYWDRINAQLYGLPPISLAPGYTKCDEEKYDLALNMKFKGFTLDARYVDRDWNGQALTKDRLLSEDYYLNLNYETTIRDGLDLSIKGYRQQVSYLSDYQAAPPGLIGLPVQNPTPPPEVIFPSVWPEGLLGKVLLTDYHMGIEIQSTYKIHDSMTIVAGATYEKQRIFDSLGWTNYLPSDTPGVFIQFSSLQPAPTTSGGELNYLAFFMEDIWDITRNIRFVTGLRYDKYYEWEVKNPSMAADVESLENLSDTPGHFSPRAGLTWEYVKGYDLKLLYGHAFIVPNVHEIANTPGFNVDPQTVDTFEISLGAEFTSSLKGRITLYQRDEKDLIVWSNTPAGFINTGELRSRGVEVEARYNFGRGTYVAGNYHYSSWPDDAGDYYTKGSIPKYAGKIMANIRLSRHFNLYADCEHFGGMSRQPEDLSNHLPADLRDNTSDYTIVNTTLIARKLLKCCEGLELRASAYNLFDEDWPLLLDRVPYGLPQPGRNFLLELRYKFK